MSERLPYEDQLQQQWDDLPLPDENAAWADMKTRLDEDDDDGVIAWWRRPGCLLWGLLLLILLVTSWWLLKPQQWFSNKTKQPLVTEQKKDSLEHLRENKQKDSIDFPGAGQPDESVTRNGDPVNSRDVNSPATIEKTAEQPDNARKKENGGIVLQNNKPSTTRTDATSFFKTTAPPKTRRKKQPNKEEVIGVQKEKEQTKPVNSMQPATPAADSPFAVTQKPVNTIPDSLPAKTKTDSVKKDTVIQELPKDKPVAKKDTTKKRNIFFSAGIAVQQQIPVAGQKGVPYNAQGRKGTLGDYIPSVYLRLNKKDKWFIQSEFRYGAPQTTKEVQYKQVAKNDTIGGNPVQTRTSEKLKKTYYHQLPLTFNYYVKPNWSVGVGVVWNRFASAVAERDVLSVNNLGVIDTLVFGAIVRVKNDTVFAKSYFQAAIETQYKWKRFSFGARYAFGLQPYIRFTLPGGTRQEQKNSSLQVFLRYELWRNR